MTDFINAEVRGFWMRVALGLKDELVASGNRIMELEADNERLRAELAAAEWAAQHVYQREPTPDEVAHAMMLERELQLLDDADYVARVEETLKNWDASDDFDNMTRLIGSHS